VNRAEERRGRPSGNDAGVQTSIATALEHHRRGRRAEARAAFGRALAAAPEARAVHRAFGFFLKEIGDLDGAISHLRVARRLDATDVDACLALGGALYDRGALDDAARCYESALQHDRARAPAWRNLGIIAHRQGRWQDAEHAFRAALAIEPSHIDTLIHLARCAIETGRRADGLRILREVVDPQCARLQRLGDALQSAEAFDEAVRTYRALLAIAPSSADAWLALATAKAQLGHDVEAQACLERAETLAPNGQLAIERAIAWRRIARFDRAEAICRETIGRDRGSEHAKVATLILATVLLDVRRPAEAVAALNEARRTWSDDPDLQLAEALGHLLLGELAVGWRLLEARFRAGVIQPLRLTAAQPLADRPRWTGETLAGRSILVDAEEGMGDTLQLLRYVPLLAARGARVVLAIYRPLARLVATLPGGVEVAIKGAPLPATDFQIPMLSLPGAFGTTLETIPWSGPYLAADAAQITAWRSRLGAAEHLRIGLVWAGNPRHTNDANRSMPARLLAGLVEDRRHRFFSLQVGARAADIAALPAAVSDLSPYLTDYAETAAVVAALDLVISVDTSVAHLAGALGTPVWVLLPRGPDWRWLLDRADTPWYPTMRLFRCPAPRDWATPLGEIRALLARDADGRRPPSGHGAAGVSQAITA
jgi:tetratricopeptide (TPR) repeat protein